jgi:DeoR family transcriptional regulator, fructose operon transcriptional repressor
VWAKDRYHRILSLLSVRGQVSNDLLIQELQVSRETIRRDILELEGAGQLKRVHGGVVSTATSPEPPFKTRVVASAAEKRRIALAAAALIQPGMLCAIDTGTTTLAFAEALAGIPNVSVVTNSFDVAATIRAAQANATIILLGGNFGVDAPGTFGKLAVSQMQQFLPDMAILSPVALDADYGATSYDLPEAELARAIDRSGDQTYAAGGPHEARRDEPRRPLRLRRDRHSGHRSPRRPGRSVGAEKQGRRPDRVRLNRRTVKPFQESVACRRYPRPATNLSHSPKIWPTPRGRSRSAIFAVL